MVEFRVQGLRLLVVNLQIQCEHEGVLLCNMHAYHGYHNVFFHVKNDIYINECNVNSSLQQKHVFIHDATKTYVQIQEYFRIF